MSEATAGDQTGPQPTVAPCNSDDEEVVVDAEIVETAPHVTQRTWVDAMRRRAQRYEASRLAEATIHGV
jgi:hypothetical protein